MINKLSYGERDLEYRVNKAKKKFATLYKSSPTVVSRAPGRAEIIGNHTDYNNGYALAAAISRSTLTLLKKRDDTIISIYSSNYSSEPITFDIDGVEAIEGDWVNYVKAVVEEMTNSNLGIRGADILVDSNVPSSGGVSSSAALELSVALGLSTLYGHNVSLMDLALLSKRAENSSLVNSPCGFLDQGAAALSQNSHFTFLDFLPKNSMPVSNVSYIPANLEEQNISLIVAVDKNVKRNLGTSGYPIRKKMCEQSIPVLSKLLKREITSLRDVSTRDFEGTKHMLDNVNSTMRKRVEHVVNENQRVLDSISALKEGNIKNFGVLLNFSGKSALNLYELDEKTPELTFLVETGRAINGVVGMRNMGGGFSANTLALVENDHIEHFQNELSEKYMNEYNGQLEFIQFNSTQGASILN